MHLKTLVLTKLTSTRIFLDILVWASWLLWIKTLLCLLTYFIHLSLDYIHHHHVVLLVTDFPDSVCLSVCLAIRLYHPSLLAGLLDCTLCPYTSCCTLVLVGLPKFVRPCEARLWVRLYFSSYVPHVLFVSFG